MKHAKTHVAHEAATTGKTAMQPSVSPQPFLKAFARTGKWLPYALLFTGFWWFATVTYGEVFERAVQESFVCSNAELMKSLTDQDFGGLYVFSRYLLLVFHSPLLGGCLLSLLLTASVFFLDRALRLPLMWRGVTSIFPAALLVYFTNWGIHLYYKSEPSLFLLLSVAFFLTTAVLGIVVPLLTKAKDQTEKSDQAALKRWPVGLLTAAVAVAGINLYATQTQDNTIRTARMQLHILNGDIAALVEDGLEAPQPSRSVAAYYAIGLLYTDRLLDDLFNISYHYPDIQLKDVDGSGEYGIFNADCNFFTGLINPSYRCAMDQVVMNGPRLYYLKRMAICAIANQEKELAKKYLNIIRQVPLENDFVAIYEPMAEQPELAQQDLVINKVMQLYPQEQQFEQHYRNPTFLGYNVGVLQGTNQALAPSIAACLYSKDLPNMAQRAIQLKQLRPALPLPVMEALSIFSRKNPGILNYFQELNPEAQFPHAAVANVNNFFITIQNHFEEKYNHAPDWRQRMAQELKNGIDSDLRELLLKDWKGHYCYYYYCENIKPKQNTQKEKSEVN